MIAAACSTPLSVGMFHGAAAVLDAAPVAYPVTYWALGGRHQPELLRRAGPVALYPGTSQGARPGDEGPRGAWVVDFDDQGNSSARFEALDAIRWTVATVEMTDDESESALVERLAAQIRGMRAGADGRALLYRVELNAPQAPSAQPFDTNALAAQLNEQFGARDDFAWCYRVVVERGAWPGRERRRQASDMLAEILHVRDDFASDPELRRRLWDELAVLLEDDRLQPYSATVGLTEGQLEALLREAEAEALAALGIQW